MKPPTPELIARMGIPVEIVRGNDGVTYALSVGHRQNWLDRMTEELTARFVGHEDGTPYAEEAPNAD